ncbi:LLM class flavin-dependent oxidoreductase [Aeromicrobium sp. UC242_57]|uniref:LLM class flavin-dependent oxidoreductase n=1 Tax=Aeromicrobium sp. UC242_57 TaxID=3374624 RepID=UPI0037A62AF7
MKSVGFLSFGHYQPVPGSQTRTASDVLLQSIDLAVAAEELGLDGAFFRVHHFARQLASPFPLLAAVGARTSTIEIGTGVIDMRYENPLYMAEDAAAADLISGGRLQLGISRGSPETAIRGYQSFGHVPPEGMSDADMARAHTGAVPGRDRRCGGRGLRSADDRPVGSASGHAPGAGPQRPHLVGVRHKGHGSLDRAAGDEPDELDAADRGHRRSVRRGRGSSRSRSSVTPGPRRAGSGLHGSRSAAA